MQKLLPMSASDLALLKTVPFIGLLTGEAGQKMLDIATSLHCKPRDIIFREHEPSDYFYCVLNGYVRLYRRNKDGREADIRICGPGDTFAACFLYAPGGYGYYAQAADNVTLARFDMNNLRQAADADIEIARSIITALSQHLLSMMDRMAKDRLQTAPQRLADYLLKCCTVESGPASVRLPFQKRLLAGMLGLAPEALSRAFSTLRQVGVTVRGRVVQVSDVETLKQF